MCDCISWRCQTNISNIFWFGTIHSFIVTNRIKVINRWPWFGDMSLVLELAGHHQVARALLIGKVLPVCHWTADEMRCSRTGGHQPAGSVADTARFSHHRSCMGSDRPGQKEGTEMFRLWLVALQARKHIYQQKNLMSHETYAPASFSHDF